MMALLLPVHAAANIDWLADATATAAERTLAAAHTLLFLEREDGTLAYCRPVSDLRRRSVQRALDALGLPPSGASIDPSTAAGIAEALDADAPVIGAAPEALRGMASHDALASAQQDLGIEAVAVAKVESAGERLGALMLLLAGRASPEQVRLLASHVACAAVNLRQATTPVEEVANIVRTVFDARKTEAELQRELTRAERYQREASICVIEATNLRLLREQFGPDLVDAAYERVGQSLAQYSRDIDVIGQYKQSGYTMVLSEATAEGAVLATKRLLGIAREAAPGDVPGLELHFAAGWATCPIDGRTAEALFAATERRMYDPKSAVA